MNWKVLIITLIFINVYLSSASCSEINFKSPAIIRKLVKIRKFTSKYIWPENRFINVFARTSLTQGINTECSDALKLYSDKFEKGEIAASKGQFEVII